jgi:putative methionine-R-sulfoxide reductase with GAF domain
MVKRKIVVPIFVRKELAAKLDVESYFANTFIKPEQDFVEACAAIVGKYLGAH